MRYDLRRINDWSYYCLPELGQKGICHGFFTKESPSPAFAGRDRTDFLKWLSLKDLVVMEQRHSDEIHVIAKGERPASGDGIIVIENGVAGIIKTADCLPVVLTDPDFPMAAIVHAGWRGTAQKITQKAVRKMIAIGAQREKVVALLGPSIRACCYEVGGEVRDTFLRAGFSERVFAEKGASVYLDLARANRELLAFEGIEHIYDTGLCTFCTPDTFASYRRGDKSARQINFVSLRG